MFRSTVDLVFVVLVLLFLTTVAGVVAGLLRWRLRLHTLGLLTAGVFRSTGTGGFRRLLLTLGLHRTLAVFDGITTRIFLCRTLGFGCTLAGSFDLLLTLAVFDGFAAGVVFLCCALGFGSAAGVFVFGGLAAFLFLRLLLF